MSARRALDSILTKTLVDEDGNRVRPSLIRLAAGETLATVRDRVHPDTPLPPEIEDLLQRGAGVEIGHLELRWDGNLNGAVLDGAFPCLYPVMDDGFGNAWVADVDPGTGRWGRIYFLCHDPPVVIFQAESFAAFLEQIATGFGRDDDPLTAVHDDAAMSVGETGGRLVPIDVARRSTDPVLARAASAATAGSWIADLRNPRAGDGFIWGKFGPDSRVSRPLADPIFIVSPPE